MTTRVNLPSGGWVDLFDPEELPEKWARKARNALFGLRPEIREVMLGIDDPDDVDQQAEIGQKILGIATADDMDALERMNDVVSSALIGAWSFGDETHPDPDRIAELPRVPYREVQEAVKVPGAKLIGPDFGPNPDPDSPTAP